MLVLLNFDSSFEIIKLLLFQFVILLSFYLVSLILIADMKHIVALLVLLLSFNLAFNQEVEAEAEESALKEGGGLSGLVSICLAL